MNWSDFLRAVLSFLSPLILDWLDDLLSDAADRIDRPYPVDPAVAVYDLFAEARGRLWVWQFWRRRVLAAAERVALKRAGELGEAARGRSGDPVMVGAELETILTA